MRLRKEILDTSEQLEEFDQWLTAKLDRIKDSDKFTTEIKSLCDFIKSISSYLDDFSDYDDCSVNKLCDAVINASEKIIVGDCFFKDEQRISDFYEAFFNLLFLTSGATDNNLKNHFLIKLNEDDVRSLIPRRGTSRKNITFILQEIPSTTKADYIAKTLASCFVGSHETYKLSIKTEPLLDLSVYLKILLREYASLILDDYEDTMQFWAICRSYVYLNGLSPDSSLGKYLLNSCTIFKVRGSVSASGGHIPENTLREKLSKIGLRPNSDFNTNDVNIGEEEIVEDGKRKKKTRAYDFILPYNIDNWAPKPKLFIQSQFYAGDSGSVSHKVIDQTQNSRAFTLEKYESARFVEYLDGAGYYASLRGDLTHMLSFDNTASFFQVKSILVRLRRELQSIYFLTPIELEHSILMSEDGLNKSVYKTLEDDGYPTTEIARVISVCIELGYITEDDGKLKISPGRYNISRRLLILDIAANYASKITDSQRKSQKYLLVPGYGANYGILESELTTLACSMCKQFNITAPTFSSDIEWLLDEGVFKRR
ncbi:hypothetical protein [Oceanisphaera arctica]|uniref:Uncharacterized protein n=1 Tax=Oceanisphaera arctica TaxID=641510 RepID=A0A2P5TN27_9GAMM|nr:hypothetical protein [Oceanisphaera arctica]PPL16863.1 hypothetical protein UN63_06980 [Oceanisphaera arctica]GHA19670.1 hypothetical protein GCM10007082_20430 [Oceanisphaera arctica]